MKKFIYILITIVLFSCNADDYLDVIPNGTLIPQTVEDYDRLLNNNENVYVPWYNVVFMDPDFVLNDELISAILPAAEFNKGQYKWSQDTYLEDARDNSWYYRYKNLYIVNLIIQNIDDAELGSKSEADRKIIKGQAYAQRAFEYFYLVNEYGPHFSANNLDVPAVPMPLVPDITAQLPRSTVGEIYNQIEKDIAVAAPLMENAPIVHEIRFRPGKASFYGMVAWVALYKGEFERAKVNADAALSLFSYQYNYTQLNNVSPGNAWSGLNNSEFTLGSTTRKDNLWGRYINAYYDRPGFIYADDLASMFDQDNDYRFILHSSHTNRTGNINVSPRFMYARYNATRMVGVTTSDLILISAEAHIRTGNQQKAIDRVNQLLETRIANFVPYQVSDFNGEAEILQLVKDERRKEFVGAGKPWFDLKRYHALGESIPTFTRVIEGQTYTLEPGSDKYIVPISKRILNLNPNL